MHDISIVTRTRIRYLGFIKLFGLLLAGVKLPRRCIYPTDWGWDGGSVSVYTLFPVLTFPQPPMWLLLVHCRAAADNMVYSALYLVWQVCVVQVCVVQVCVRGNRERVGRDVRCRLARHSLLVSVETFVAGRFSVELN